MNFVSATTARAMVEEYNNTARQRFLNDLNDKIIECAKKGLNECCISLRDCPEQERESLIIFLTRQGFNCIPHKNIDYFKIKW